MSRNIILLALVTVPLLYLLPLNLVRFQWGLKNGRYAMPPDVEEKAEAGDRVVSFVTHLVLLFVVVLSMRSFSVSEYEVGLTLDNWKSALGMGVMLSRFPWA